MNQNKLFFIFIFLSFVVAVTGGSLITWRFIDQQLLSADLRQFILKLHIFSSVGFIFILGMMATSHFLPHIMNNMRKARKSGLTLVSIILLMILSGFLLQMISSMLLLEWIYWLHVITSGIFYGVFILHRLRVGTASNLRIHAGWLTLILLSLLPIIDTLKKPENLEDEFFLGEESFPELEKFNARLFLMGTDLDIEYYSDSNLEVFDKLAILWNSLEAEISHYKPNSTITKLNQNQLTQARLSDAAYQMMNEADTIRKQSNGAFDPGFHSYGQHGQEQRCFHFSNNWIEKKCPEAELDFGGIGKGYALDLALDAIQGEAKCIEMNFAGQVLFNYQDETCNPARQFVFRDVPGKVLLDKKIGSISTSGNHGVRLLGQRGHIYDRANKVIAERDYTTVVYSASATLADGWSTALYVAGPEKGIKLAAKYNVDVLYIFDDGSYKGRGNSLKFARSL